MFGCRDELAVFTNSLRVVLLREALYKFDSSTMYNTNCVYIIVQVRIEPILNTMELNILLIQHSTNRGGPNMSCRVIISTQEKKELSSLPPLWK